MVNEPWARKYGHHFQLLSARITRTPDGADREDVGRTNITVGTFLIGVAYFAAFSLRWQYNVPTW